MSQFELFTLSTGDGATARRAYNLDVMAYGIGKIKDGWPHDDAVWVQFDDGKRLKIPASQYRWEGFKPPIKQLPECKGEQHA